MWKHTGLVALGFICHGTILISAHKVTEWVVDIASLVYDELMLDLMTKVVALVSN